MLNERAGDVGTFLNCLLLWMTSKDDSRKSGRLIGRKSSGHQTKIRGCACSGLASWCLLLLSDRGKIGREGRRWQTQWLQSALGVSRRSYWTPEIRPELKWRKYSRWPRQSEHKSLL